MNVAQHAKAGPVRRVVLNQPAQAGFTRRFVEALADPLHQIGSTARMRAVLSSRMRPPAQGHNHSAASIGGVGTPKVAVLGAMTPPHFNQQRPVCRGSLNECPVIRTEQAQLRIFRI